MFYDLLSKLFVLNLRKTVIVLDYDIYRKMVDLILNWLATHKSMLKIMAFTTFLQKKT